MNINIEQSTIDCGLNSVQAPSASHNCAGVARKFLSAKEARAAGLVSLRVGKRLQHPPCTRAPVNPGNQAGQF